MIIVSGNDKDRHREMTLTINEAKVLCKELERAVEESKDHKSICNVDITSLNGAGFSFKIKGNL